MNNSFFLHPEHLILALLSDKRKMKRKQGKQLVMKARASEDAIDGVRLYEKIELHQINLKAENFWKIKFESSISSKMAKKTNSWL